MPKIRQTYRANAHDNGGVIRVGLGYDRPVPRSASMVLHRRPRYAPDDGAIGGDFLELNYAEAEAIATVLAEVLRTGDTASFEVPLYSYDDEVNR